MFELHPQLENDTFILGRYCASHVLLHKKSAVLWFIIVPETDATEIFEMRESERAQLRTLVDQVSAFVKGAPGIQKVNVAAIGNMVPQLHLHVVGRSPDDPFWPGVVWGQPMDDAEWSATQVEEFRRRLIEQSLSNPG